MAPEMVAVSWNDFTTTASNTVRNLYCDHDFVDVTIACEGEKQIKAHKVILSSSSSFFRNILVQNPHEHPLICLAGVKYDQIQKIVEYMYLGEVKIAQTDVSTFIELGRELQIGGIIDELFENDTATAIPESDAGSTTGDLVDPLQDKELFPINEDNAENCLCVLEDIKEEFFEDSDVPKEYMSAINVILNQFIMQALESTKFLSTMA